MDDLMPPPPGLSPVGGKLVVARFERMLVIGRGRVDATGD